MVADKQHAHQLLDQLDSSQLAAVAQSLEVVVDAPARSVPNAREEDEEITPETTAELDRARASLEGVEGIPLEEILCEFGLASRV